MTTQTVVTFDPTDLTKGVAIHDVKKIAQKRIYITPRDTNFVGIAGNPGNQGFYANPENVLAIDPSPEVMENITVQFEAMKDELATLEQKRTEKLAEVDAKYAEAFAAYKGDIAEVEADHANDFAEVIANLKSALKSAA